MICGSFALISFAPPPALRFQRKLMEWTIDRSLVLQATEKRKKPSRISRPSPTSPASYEYNAFDADYTQRRHFRRIIDSDILARNPKPIAREALRIISRLADNLLKEPTNPKYQKFKRTNPRIEKYLEGSKGSLELVQALGFGLKVDQLQPYYVFNESKTHHLELGYAVLKEIIQRETIKEAEEADAPEREKAAEQAVKFKIQRKFMNDRKRVEERVRAEREETTQALAKQ